MHTESARAAEAPGRGPGYRRFLVTSATPWVLAALTTAAASSARAQPVVAEPEVATSVVPPRLVFAEDPIYPATELEGAQHPSVVFQVVIDRDGSVRSSEVEHSAGEAFDTAAAAALAHWRFEPASRGGVSIASRVRVAVHFELPRFDVPTTEPHAHDVMEVEGGVLDAERHDVHDPDAEAIRDAAADAANSTEGANVEAQDEDVATARAVAVAPPLRNQSRSISDFHLDRRALSLAPHRDAGHLLESAPGMVVTRPEGDVAAHHILLRGFDAEHGQDIELTLDGLPLNQPSHLHGQGYADLGFIIPEVVRGLRVTEGVYDPSQGDFAVAGSADFRLGVEQRGTRIWSEAGSFQTLRSTLVVAPTAESEDTFIAVSARRTGGYGPNRAGLSASAMAQWGVDVGAWRFRVLGSLAGARGEFGGVVRRDDINTVGFYGTYDTPSARAQNAFSARGLLALFGERHGVHDSTTDFSVHVGVTDFRMLANFTGFLEPSQTDPTMPGTGDLLRQQNRTQTLGMRFRHRGERFHLGTAVDGTLEVGVAMRVDQTTQSLSLIDPTTTRELDGRVDATILGSDLGAWVDADVDLGRRASLRGGVRADALFYDVANHHDATSASAYGIAAGPRASLDVHPRRGPAYVLAYGEGYRSPQALNLRDGERAPYTKVRSADVGLHHEASFGVNDEVTLRLRASAFMTHLSNDVVFEASENSVERVGPSRRTGAVISGEFSAWDSFDVRASVTGVRATLLGPPPAVPGDPPEPFVRGTHVPYVPPVVVRIDAGVHHTIANVAGRPVRGALGVGLSHIGARPLTDGANADPFTLLDAHVDFRYRGVALGVSAQNLIGVQYAASEYSYVSNWNPGSAPSNVPERTIAAGTPRTVMFTLEIAP